MKKTILIFLLLGACKTGGHSFEINIGDPIPKEKSSPVLLLTSAGQLSPGFKFSSGGIHYEATLDDSLRIDYLSTADSLFITPEGVRTGMAYSAVKKNARGKGELRPGWGYAMPLASGWNCVFTDGAVLDKYNISDTCRVMFFFKRR